MAAQDNNDDRSALIDPPQLTKQKSEVDDELRERWDKQAVCNNIYVICN